MLPSNIIMIMIYLVVVVGYGTWLQDVVAQIVQARHSCIKYTTICPVCVDFREAEKPEHPEKNPQSTGVIDQLRKLLLT